MSSRHLVDADLAGLIDLLPDTPIDAANLPQIREQAARQVEMMRAQMPEFPLIEVSEHRVAGRDGAPEVRIVCYQPRTSDLPLPALLWIHGGGYVAGNPECDDLQIKNLVSAIGCVVVSVDYRLAPETRAPGSVEDCYAALQWLHGHAEELGVDASRIAVAGQSAGGGLAAALCLLARDRGDFAIAFQALLQPMLDDRSTGSAPQRPLAGEFVWKAAYNQFGWSALLGHEGGLDDVSPYAAPARAESLAGLPATFISVGALDLFVDEDIDYARRLIHDGVPCELHVYPGGFHGFHLLAPQAWLTLAHDADWFAALRRALFRDGAEPAPASTAGPGAAAEAPPDPALLAQLALLMPGISAHDLPRFARSISIPGTRLPRPVSRRQPGVPEGRISHAVCPAGALYPAVEHAYSVYVPAQHEGCSELGLMVFQDGAQYLGDSVNATVVLDNLIHAGAMPPLVAVFVEPGATGPGLPIYLGSGNRSVEYDSIDDRYARFLIEELLPQATQGLRISAAPERRAICGLSSGGVCAFNVAWQRPDRFGKVISHCGSFVDIRGGHRVAAQVRESDPKPLRVFLQTGSADLDIVFGNWVDANRLLASALAYRGYDHQLVIGDGGHSLVHGGAIFPDTLRWLWRDHVALP